MQKGQSVNDLSVKATVKRYHINHFDQLLNSNDFRRLSVASNGNFFFSSVLKSAGMERNPLQFREQICDYMIDSIERYIVFCTLIDRENTYLDEHFLQDINALSSSDVLNVGVWDCLLLAVADMTKSITMRIHSILYLNRSREYLFG